MADVSDLATDREMENLADALAAQAIAASKAPRPTGQGSCLNPQCAEDFGDDMQRLYCGPKCAASHARFSRN